VKAKSLHRGNYRKHGLCCQRGRMYKSRLGLREFMSTTGMPFACLRVQYSLEGFTSGWDGLLRGRGPDKGFSWEPDPENGCMV